MALDALLSCLGPEISDSSEGKTFLLFSQPTASRNLGFVDSKASTLDITVAGRDFVIHQSPTVLASNRSGGTTGAVLWGITPLFAEWLASHENLLFSSRILTAESAVLELGCGISALTGLVVGPLVSTYILTDQPYVSKLVERNLSENLPDALSRLSKDRKSKPITRANPTNIHFSPLDWETDQPTPSLTGSPKAKSFDAVIACDCIYNEALIQPLVQTCAAVCNLRTADTAADVSRPCVCIIAQQLRDSEVFEA